MRIHHHDTLQKTYREIYVELTYNCVISVFRYGKGGEFNEQGGK